MTKAEKLAIRYTFTRPVVVQGEPDAQTVWIKVGPRSFRVDGYAKDKLHAQQLRLQIGSALAAIIRTATTPLIRELTALVRTTQTCTRALDEEMGKPSNFERGSRVAKITNALEMQKDHAKHFGLGKPLKRSSKVKSP